MEENQSLTAQGSAQLFWPGGADLLENIVGITNAVSW